MSVEHRALAAPAFSDVTIETKALPLQRGGKGLGWRGDLSARRARGGPARGTNNLITQSLYLLKFVENLLAGQQKHQNFRRRIFRKYEFVKLVPLTLQLRRMSQYF